MASHHFVWNSRVFRFVLQDKFLWAHFDFISILKVATWLTYCVVYFNLPLRNDSIKQNGYFCMWVSCWLVQWVQPTTGETEWASTRIAQGLLVSQLNWKTVIYIVGIFPFPWNSSIFAAHTHSIFLSFYYKKSNMIHASLRDLMIICQFSRIF